MASGQLWPAKARASILQREAAENPGTTPGLLSGPVKLPGLVLRAAASRRPHEAAVDAEAACVKAPTVTGASALGTVGAGDSPLAAAHPACAMARGTRGPEYLY